VSVTIVLPLSAFTMVDSFSISFFFIFVLSLHSVFPFASLWFLLSVWFIVAVAQSV
jgi:hypothetical protein